MICSSTLSSWYHCQCGWIFIPDTGKNVRNWLQLNDNTLYSDVGINVSLIHGHPLRLVLSILYDVSDSAVLSTSVTPMSVVPLEYWEEWWRGGGAIKWGRGRETEKEGSIVHRVSTKCQYNFFLNILKYKWSDNSSLWCVIKMRHNSFFPRNLVHFRMRTVFLRDDSIQFRPYSL